jgi:hypothetical protein
MVSDAVIVMLSEGRRRRQVRDMTTPPSSSTSSSATPAVPGPSLRVWGILVLVFFLLSSAVGGSLALESSYLPVTLASHIGLALVTLGLAGYATSFTGRSYKAMPRGFAGLSALSALGATIAGTIFLVGGQSTAALYAMEGFAGIGIVSAVLMIVFGGHSGKRVSVAPLS